MLYDIKDNTLVLEYKDKLNSYFIDHETKDELELWHYKYLLVNFTVSLGQKDKKICLNGIPILINSLIELVLKSISTYKKNNAVVKKDPNV
ncbi:MAG: hypothetical protein IPL98_16080 [Saprospiraceae bacterium]|nr:hypothetical protein [Saprospiraceae bacterium]